MKIPINLASEPFRKSRPVLLATVVLGAVLTLTLALQVYLIVAERGRLADTRASVSRLNAQLQQVQNGQARLDALLRQPENAQVLLRNQLLNTLIDRKAISWTKLFADLEGVMPYDVRLIAVRLPQINSQQEVLLDMVVGAKSPEPVLQLLRRLESSPLFGQTTVHTFLPPSQNQPLYQYRVSVSYAQKL